MDKRILKTTTNIKNAFMQLATEGDVNKITVSDIAEKAMINRSTFYLHYQDAQAVSLDIEKDISDKIARHFKKFDIYNIYNSTFDMFTRITDELDKDIVLKKYLVFSSDSVRMVKKLKEFFTETAVETLLSSFKNLDKNDIYFPLNFATAGIVENYITWARIENCERRLEELISEVVAYTNFIIESITK